MDTKTITTGLAIGAVVVGAVLFTEDRTPQDIARDRSAALASYDTLSRDRGKLNPQDQAVIDSIVNGRIIPPTLTVQQIDRIIPQLTDDLWKARFGNLRKSLERK